MRGVKQQVIQMIQALPEDVSIDDIMAEIYFKLQVDSGLKELDERKGIPHEEVEKSMYKWLTKLDGHHELLPTLKIFVTTLPGILSSMLKTILCEMESDINTNWKAGCVDTILAE